LPVILEGTGMDVGRWHGRRSRRRRPVRLTAGRRAAPNR